MRSFLAGGLVRIVAERFLDFMTGDGFDVGNVVAQRKTASGMEDVVYGVDFAFAFHAFYPEAEIATK